MPLHDEFVKVFESHFQETVLIFKKTKTKTKTKTNTSTMMMIIHLPGWMMITRTSPMEAASKEVNVKKAIVLVEFCHYYMNIGLTSLI